jgi:hypothetical protein
MLSMLKRFTSIRQCPVTQLLWAADLSVDGPDDFFTA